MVHRPEHGHSGKPSHLTTGTKEVVMPLWAIILIIVLLFLALFGGRRYL